MTVPGSTSPDDGPAARLMALLPAALVVLAEGAWVAVIYALFQGASQKPMVLGPFSLALFAGSGLVAARRFEPSLRGRWPVTAIALTGVAAVLGCLAATATWAALVSGTPAAALVSHPGGWLAGLAFLRGTAHARPASSEASAATLMTLAIPAIAVAFLLGGAIAEPGRSWFQEAALTATIVFIASGTLALALARIGGLSGSSGGLDWRRNPAWLGLLLVLVAGILAVAIPASSSLGPLVLLLVALLPVPLFFVGLVVGIDRTARRSFLVLLGVGVVIVVLMRLGVNPPPTLETTPGGLAGQPSPPDQTWMAVAAWMIFLIVLAAAIALLSALWMRQALARGADDVAEERTIDYGTADVPVRPRRRWRLPRTGPAPTNAAEAYLALVRDLAGHEDLRRQPTETPAEHARRLRELGAAERFGAAVDLLAADYELARFGGAALTAKENRRALARWRRVRARLGRRGLSLQP